MTNFFVPPAMGGAERWSRSTNDRAWQWLDGARKTVRWGLNTILPSSTIEPKYSPSKLVALILKLGQLIVMVEHVWTRMLHYIIRL